MRSFRLAAAALLAAPVALAACQAGSPSDALSLKTNTGATETVVAIAQAAQTCWFKSKDRAFAGFRLANEVNSPSGRPRFLLVPKNNPGGLPLLVVQAEKKGSATTGTYTAVQAFGPLLDTPNGSRINADVQRWATGNSACTA
jgi:hypothetical protein